MIQIISDMGIEFTSCIQQSSHTINYTLTNESIEQESDFDWGFGFYLLHGIRDGFYSQNDYARSSTGIVDIAKQLLQQTPSDQISSPNPSNTDRSVIHDIRSEGPFKGSMVDTTSTLISDLRNTLKELGDVKFHVNLLCQDIKKSVQNSLDNNIIHLYNRAKLNITLVDKENPESYISLLFGGIQANDCDLDRIFSSISDAYLSLRQLRDARMVKPNHYPTILSPDTSYSLIHESIGHGCEADQVITNQSFLSNKMGFKVGASSLTITDDPHLRGVGWSEYDDEGTKTKGTLLVEDGILVDYLQTRRTAKILNSPPTGNARATNYLEKPDARQSNLFIEPKDYSLEELLEEVENGIYLGPTEMASMSIFTGDLYIQTQFGRKIENGELTDHTKPIILSGNSLNILKKVKNIGNSVEKFPTECSKSQSRLDIGGYSPHLMIDDLFMES